MAKICNQCKAENLEMAKFCVSCGQPLVPSVQPMSTPNSSMPPSVSTTVSVSPSITGQTSSIKKTIVTILALLFMPVLGYALVFFWSGWSRKAKILAIIIPLVISLLLILVGIIFGIKNNQANNFFPISSSLPTVSQQNGFSNPTQQVAQIDLKDTDNDGVPDWVEVGAGMDPNRDECAQDISSCGLTFKAGTGIPENVLVIFDSSGSMAEKLSDGSVKIDAAKEKVQSMLTSLPPSTKVSLVVYGAHGSNSFSDKNFSCQGIDILYPLDEAKNDEITKALSSFSPTGWTPIASSLEKALQVFTGKEARKNYIFLASDGEETCGGNPLATVQNIKAKLSNLTIDVAGLNVTGVGKDQLTQIAQAGGGKFYDVQSKNDLSQIWTYQYNAMQAVDFRMCLNAKELAYNQCNNDKASAAAKYLNDYVGKIPSEQHQKYFDLISKISSDRTKRQTAFGNYLKTLWEPAFEQLKK